VLFASLLQTGACRRPDGGPGVYDAHGVVESVDREYGQVLIHHDDIPGLMPEMTMSFDVPDPELLARIQPRQVIDFRLEFTGRAYHVIDVTLRGDAAETGHGTGASFDAVVPRGDPAPAFALTDQDGNLFSLVDLRGKAILLDFIYTSCPGPCPILTGLHVEVQRALDPALRNRVHLVSVSLDPLTDTPTALREYARKRGADTANWSFLTGAPDAIETVLKAYGVGSARQPDGTIAHLVVTFLIDGTGQIVQRYVGLDAHDPAQLRADLERLAGEGRPQSASEVRRGVSGDALVRPSSRNRSRISSTTAHAPG
jgi:protein SCO1/2